MADTEMPVYLKCHREFLMNQPEPSCAQRDRAISLLKRQNIELHSSHAQRRKFLIDKYIPFFRKTSVIKESGQAA